MAVVLLASDGSSFEVDGGIVQQSSLLKDMLADLGESNDQPIRLENISRSTLSKIIDYMSFHQSVDKQHDSVKEWDAKFMQIDQGSLYDLILAANFLDLRQLLDLCCKTVALMIDGKSADAIRSTFNIQSDLSTEELEMARQEFGW